MINIHFHPMPTDGEERRWCYRVAQQDLAVKLYLDALHGYEKRCSDHALSTIPWDPANPMDKTRQLYQGPGWIGNEWREVACWSVTRGYQIAVTGIGDNWVSDDGNIIVISHQPGVAKELVVEAALGPALILALAIHDTWCLHGSAAIFNDQVIIFLGESGKGKSTLARWLDAQDGETWQCVSDDILPVSLSTGRLEALPHFPQLKLPAGEQPSSGLPERLPVLAMYVLDRPTEDDGVEIKSLDNQEGTLALVRHTVASRLFAADLLVKHLDFCVESAAQTRVKKLVYPLHPEALPEIQERLLEDLQPSEN